MYENSGIQLPQVFLAAAQARNAELDRRQKLLAVQEAERQDALRPQLEEARAKAMAGNLNDLARLAPGEALLLQKQFSEQGIAQGKLAVDQQNANTNAIKAQGDRYGVFVKRATDDASIISNAARMVLKDPNQYGAALSMLRDAKANGMLASFDPSSLDPNNPPSPEQLSQMLAQNQAMLQSLRDPDFSGALKEAANAFGISDYNAALGDQRVQEVMRKSLEGKAKGSGTTVNVDVNPTINASPLTTANETTQQNKLIDTRGTIYALNQLNQFGDPAQFLTLGAKGQQWAFSSIDKIDGVREGLSDSDREQLGKAKQFRSRVKQFFNAYRKMITGAGASTTELEQLENSVLNDNLSPTEFTALLKQTMSDAQRDEQIISNILGRGVQLSKDEFAAEFDRLRSEGMNPDDASTKAENVMPQSTVTTGKGKNAKTVTQPRMSEATLRTQARAHVSALPDAAKYTPAQRKAIEDAYIQEHARELGLQ